MQKSVRLFIAPLAAAAIMIGASPATAAEAPPLQAKFDGGGDDTADAMAIDAEGNLYVGGESEATSTDKTFSVTKVDPVGHVVWHSIYNGAGTRGRVSALAVDGAGNVYAAGSISGTTSPDSLVVKFDQNGVQVWTQTSDGPAHSIDEARNIAVDPTGNVYVSGNSIGSGTGYDWVTQRVSPGGVLQWTRRHAGLAGVDDTVADMMLAPSGNLVVTGQAVNAQDTVTADADVVTYDPQGNPVWQRQWTITPASHEDPQDLDIDSSGTIIVTGFSAATAGVEVDAPLPATVRLDAAGSVLQVIRAGGGAIDVTPAGDFYLSGSQRFGGNLVASATSKYDKFGTLVWNTPMPTASREALWVNALVVDSTGTTTVTAQSLDEGTLNRDALTIRYSAQGQELWRHRLNGAANRNDAPAGVALDNLNNAWVAATATNLSPSGFWQTDIVGLKFLAGTTPGPAIPGTPSQLTATSPSRSQMTLTWKDNATNEAGFRVERCKGIGCTNFLQVATVGPNLARFTDSGLSRSTTYTYRLQAFNNSGDSPFSNSTSARTRS